MGEAVDLRAAIPNLKQRLGPNAYDDALRERLKATQGLGEQATQFSEQQALKRQRDAYAARMQALQSRQVPSPAAGGVIEALLDTGNKGFGKNVRVKFDNGSYGIFGHLSSWLGNLKVGSKFTGGSQLGYTGNSGDSSGDHLHFETRWNLYDPGTSFDPSSWFGW